MTLPVHILARVPGATETVRWEEICRSGTAFVMINHEPTRNTSRWSFVERKRPFIVCYRSKKAIGWAEMSAHKTLDAAIAAAKRLAESLT